MRYGRAQLHVRSVWLFSWVHVRHKEFTVSEKLSQTTLEVYFNSQISKHIVTCQCDYRRGLDWWLDLLNTYKQLVTTSNYNNLTGLHTLKTTVTAAHVIFYVFISRFLVTNPNNVSCLRPYRLANNPQLTHCFRCRLSTNFPGCHISTRTAQKTHFLCYFSIFSMGTCVLEKPLLSNDSCIFALLAVVAKQRVYILEYASGYKNVH
jgi:hypothetical protein